MFTTRISSQCTDQKANKLTVLVMPAAAQPCVKVVLMTEGADLFTGAPHSSQEADTTVLSKPLQRDLIVH